MKLKIKSSARAKERYLLLEAKDKEEVENAILEYLGILGWAKASPRFIDKEGKIVLSVNRKELTNVRAAFELSDKKIRIIRVSGTLKGLGKK